MFVIEESIAGNIITEVDSVQEGVALIAEYEAQDRAEGIFRDDFYEIVEGSYIETSRGDSFFSRDVYYDSEGNVRF